MTLLPSELVQSHEDASAQVYQLDIECSWTQLGGGPAGQDRDTAGAKGAPELLLLLLQAVLLDVRENVP